MNNSASCECYLNTDLAYVFRSTAVGATPQLAASNIAITATGAFHTHQFHGLARQVCRIVRKGKVQPVEVLLNASNYVAAKSCSFTVTTRFLLRQCWCFLQITLIWLNRERGQQVELGFDLFRTRLRSGRVCPVSLRFNMGYAKMLFFLFMPFSLL